MKTATAKIGSARLVGKTAPQKPAANPLSAPALAAVKDSAAKFAALAALKMAAAGGSAPKAGNESVAIKMPVVLDQGNTNGCGTNSLANILNNFNGGDANAARALQQKADRAIRNGDMFSAPDDLVSFAEKNGFRAAIKTDASVGDITKMIDQGVPVQVLIDSGSRGDFAQHYIAVVGYEKDASGKVKSLKIADSAGGNTYDMPIDKFMDKWTDLPMGGVSTGMSRVMMTYVPKGDRLITAPDGTQRKASSISLPSNGFFGEIFSNSQPGRAIGQGVLNIVNGWKQKDPAKILGGVVQGVVGVGGQILSIAGNYAQKGGQAAIDWGKKKWNQGGLGNKILGGLGIVGGGIAKGVGFAVQKVGNAVAWVGSKVGGAIVKVGGAIVSGVKKVGSAIGSAAKAVGKGIKKIFSGW
jgi:hypothetical protein